MRTTNDFLCPAYTWQSFINVDANEREGKDVSRIFVISWAVVGAVIWLGLHWLIVKQGDDTRNRYLTFCIHKVNLSNFAFILACFVQYGIALHYSHLNANDSLKAQNVTIARQRSECVTLEETGNTNAFHILLWTLPMLVITNMMYPYPDEKEMSTLITGFSMLDIIDMAELMFGDVGCFQNYGSVWLFFFYTALLMSAFITTSYSGLEQEKYYYDMADRVTTCLSLVFNDLLFWCLRITTMVKEGHAYFGVIFVGKESMSSILRIILLRIKQR
ncbi:uncharacterized protein [Clytia hemisphaerica]|uniref:Uncharacterized protein n=1 Tax=Clytia hemisphaerica TaxID=252671 RepID=A0A7M6DQS7_9CNID